MKKVFIAILAVGALASCSSDDLVSISREPITFGEASIGKGTRAATDPSYGAKKPLNEFQVWGKVTGNTGNSLNIYNGADVERRGVADGEAFWCSQTEYWVPSATYNFAAVAHATKVTTADGLPSVINYTADGVSDLLYAEPITAKTDISATPTSGVNANKCVPFVFSHLLSKVHFSFLSTSQDLTVSDTSITGYFTQGTYTIGAATPWVAATTSATPLSFGAAAGTVNDDEAVTSALARLIIPGAQTWNITIVQDGKPINAELTHAFEPNTEYNILVTLQGASAITFTITSIEGWNNEEQDIPLDF